MNNSKLDPEYVAFLGELTGRVRNVRTVTANAVNSQLIYLHWEIGRMISEREEALGSTEAVIESLARDLQAAYPACRGFTPGNLSAMRKFHMEYSRDQALQQLVANYGTRRRLCSPRVLSSRQPLSWPITLRRRCRPHFWLSLRGYLGIITSSSWTR